MGMMALKVPILSVFTGEGGSGGALALAVAEEVWMLENAIYSVISPEGCASILWKDAAKAEYAAECLKLTAADLLEIGAVERIIPEDSFQETYAYLGQQLGETFQRLLSLPTETLLENRYQRFRRMGASETCSPL
jgi:acetyl-CoA carboxylase carboxyl transferase subunit alpha